jgi:hypothetical protein
MPYLRPLITTNWDRYFEEECGATPFVYESDVPFWEVAKRALLKIHGSIDNYASIVASTDDYERCEQRLRDGALGAVLKQIFATKTLIFCGYSASDPDFLNLFGIIQTGLGAFARTHYIVSPFVSDADRDRLASLNIIPIKTDATYFLSVVKDHMCEKFCFAKDFSYEFISKLLPGVIQTHFVLTDSYRPADEPHLIYATVFQDGLIHALQRIEDLAHTGSYADLHKVRGQIASYHAKLESFSKSRDYWEVSYFSGYVAGLMFFDFLNVCAPDELPPLPLFFHPMDRYFDSEEEFTQVVRHNPEIHKAALKAAKKMVRSQPTGTDVIQHLPWG